MSVDLVLLTNCTSINEALNKRHETWPPKVSLKDSLNVKDAHVAGGGGGMQEME